MSKLEKSLVNKPKHAERAIKCIEKLLQYVEIKEEQNLLEVGCGVGAVSEYMAEKYQLNVTGTDVDPEQIQTALKDKDDSRNIRFLEADAAKLPFEDDEFDMVMFYMVMHHIANWLDALREMSRVLKPKGYLIMGDIIYSGFSAKIGRLFKHSYGIMTVKDLNAFTEANDLSTIHTSLSKLPLMKYYEAVYRLN